MLMRVFIVAAFAVGFVNGDAPTIEASDDGVVITVDAGQEVVVVTRAGQGEKEKRVSLQQLSESVDTMEKETESLWQAIAKLQDADDVLTAGVNSKVSTADNDVDNAAAKISMQKTDTAITDLQTAVRALEEDTPEAPTVCKPFTVENGIVDEPLEILAGVHARVICNDLFYVVGRDGAGDDDRQCGSNGEWNSDAPTCTECSELCADCKKDGTCRKCDETSDVNEEGLCVAPAYGSSSKNAAKSCKDVMTTLGGSAKSGMYYVYRGGGGGKDKKETIRVYCDMDADGGGWAGIMNAVAQEDGLSGVKGFAKQWPPINSMASSVSDWESGTQELVRGAAIGEWIKASEKNGYTYSEIRFRCKSDGHVVDIKSTSDDVLAFFTNGVKRASPPDACNSEVLDGDTGSTLGSNCKYWGSSYADRKITTHTQTWGISGGGNYEPGASERLYRFPVFIWGTALTNEVPDAPATPAHFAFDGNMQRFECDNQGNANIKKGDEWQIFIR